MSDAEGDVKIVGITPVRGVESLVVASPGSQEPVTDETKRSLARLMFGGFISGSAHPSKGVR